MHQRFSVLGLIFFILVSAENQLTLLNNVHYKLIDTNSNKSTVRLKEIFLNK
jgi:hypothetical protein